MSDRRPERVGGEVEFAGYSCVAYKTRYAAEHGGGRALLLADASDGQPVATATVNVAGISENLPDDVVVVKDYSENEGMMDALLAAGIVEAVDHPRVPVGYTDAPLARLLFVAAEDR